MLPRFAKTAVKSSFNALGYALHDLGKNNDLRVFLPGHLKALFKRLEINCVIDVGANVGQYALMLRQMGYRGRIVSIEPVSDVFQKLCASAAGDDKWITLNTACGIKEEARPLNVFEETPLSSFLNPSSNLPLIHTSPIERTETVNIKRLDSLFDEAVQGLENPRVFLKTDAQGLDLDVIKGAGECVNRIEALQSEISVIPLYVGVPDYLEYLVYCRGLGFEPTAFFPIINSPVGGHLVEFDVVLIKRHWSNIESALVESSQN